MRDAAVFLFVDARRPSSTCGSSDRKATHLRCSDSFHSLLSVFPCGSPMALREKRQRTFGAPTRFTPCCRIFHADRFALRENPQRSLRSLQLTAFVAVRFSVRIADGSPGKKATHLRCSDSFHSLLSHFPCRSLRSLGKSATLAALTPTASPAG